MDTDSLIFSVLVSITCLMSAGCAEIQERPATPAASEPLREVPQPGRKLVMNPDRVWALEGCESRPLPFLRLDLSEVIPAMVKPGGLLNYRFPYTACVPAQPGYILGRLQTTLSFKGNNLNTRTDEGFPVQTGRWIVDTNIAIPKDAEPGVYVLEAALLAKGATINDRVSFGVEPQSYAR
jgi:hypothetical protein